MNCPSESMNGSPEPSLLGERTRQAEVIVHLLTRWVRVVSDRQLVGLDRRRARQLLRQLQRVDLVELRIVLTPPELPLEAPLFVWRPGDEPPRFDRLAWRLASRWTKSLQRTLVATATDRARLATGSLIGGHALRRTEVAHDLQVTALYLKFVQEAPDRAECWIHEDAVSSQRECGELIPDALVGDTAIEFGGRYRAAKLRAIHRGHAVADRPYEIW